MNKKIFLLVVIGALIVAALTVLRFSAPEDTWICQGDLWVKHGNPSVPMPDKPCTYGNSDSGLVQSNSAGLANPASVNCLEKGGQLIMEQRPNGGEFGICYFADMFQCEEWALYRGECPVGGIWISGYGTIAGRYCAITGGTYEITINGDELTEKGNCVLPNGTICDAYDYYDGSCPHVE